MVNKFAKTVAHSLFWMVLCALVGNPAYSSQWDLDPSLKLGFSHVDNIFLSPEDNEKSGYYYRLAPSILLTGRGSSSSLDLGYLYRDEKYLEGSNERNQRHQLYTHFRTGPHRNYWSLYGDASYDQVAKNVDARLAPGGVLAEGDYYNLGVAMLRPEFHVADAAFMNAQASVEFGSIDSDDEETDDSIYIGKRARLYSGRQFNAVTWGASLSEYENDSDVFGMEVYRSSVADITFLVSRKLKVSVAGGYEEYEYENETDSPRGQIVDYSIYFAMSPRTKIKATAGERYYGNTSNGQIVHESRHGKLTIAHTRYLTRKRDLIFERVQEDGFGTGNLTGTGASRITENLSVAGADDRYVRTKSSMDYTWSSAKTTLAVFGFRETREYQTIANEERQFGGDIIARWRFRPKSELELTVQKTVTESDQSGESTVRYLEAALNNRLRRNSRLRFSFERNISRIRFGTVDAYRYETNTISAEVVLDF